MSVPRVAAALLTASFWAAAPCHAASPAEGVAAFLLRSDEGAHSFVADGAEEGALGAAARTWAGQAGQDRVAHLAAVATPGSDGEARLVRALAKWTGEGRIAGALAAVDQSKAVERARQLSGRKIRAGFGKVVPQ